MPTAEPGEVYPESTFEDALVEAIGEILQDASRKHVLLRHFGLDVAVFVESPAGVELRLFEVKSFGAQRAGGVGFGNGQGKGPQVDLLACTPESMPLFTSNVRWVLADATLPAGSARYACFTSETAREAAMGGVARGKQNNLRISSLKPYYSDWDTLLSEVKAFLLE